jgi:hypothetical protein
VLKYDNEDEEGVEGGMMIMMMIKMENKRIIFHSLAFYILVLHVSLPDPWKMGNILFYILKTCTVYLLNSFH